MQAPRFRMNERTTNPNEYIAFIRSLKHKKDASDAEDILRAVAAQMKNIFKQRHMLVGTLEEAEFNKVFAGRNWNHGQSIELVLRGPSGRFLPMPYIISVMCHEMAHIEQMNHGPKFQKLMGEIKSDVKRMQDRGYYGDGFWSDGVRLKDNVKMGGEGLHQSDFPEYVCGVSAGDAKKAKRPRRPRRFAGPSLSTGRQTEIRRKTGARNTADMGSGTRLDGRREITKSDREERKAWIDKETNNLVAHGLALSTAKRKAGERFDNDNPWWKEGSTRGKRAQTKSAAEMRAEAIAKRLSNLPGPSGPIKPDPEAPSESDESASEIGDAEVKEEIEDPHLGLDERRKEIEEMDEDEKDGLRGGWEDYVFDSQVNRSEKRKRELSVDGASTTSKEERKISPRIPTQSTLDFGVHGGTRMGKIGGVSFGRTLVAGERDRALGLQSSSSGKGPSRLLGKDKKPSSVELEHKPSNTLLEPDTSGTERRTRADGTFGWSCKTCTFVNIIDHGRCEMCGCRQDGIMPSDVII